MHTYGAPFVNLLFISLLVVFFVIWSFTYDNLITDFILTNNKFYYNWLFDKTTLYWLFNKTNLLLVEYLIKPFFFSIGYLIKPIFCYLVNWYNQCCVTCLFDLSNLAFFVYLISPVAFIGYLIKPILRSLFIRSMKPLLRGCAAICVINWDEFLFFRHGSHKL